MTREKEYKKFIIMLLVVFVISTAGMIVTGSKTMVYGSKGYLKSYEAVERMVISDTVSQIADSFLYRYAADNEGFISEGVTTNFYYKAYATDFFKQIVHTTQDLPSEIVVSDYYVFSATGYSSDGQRYCTMEIYVDKNFPVMDDLGGLHTEVKDDIKERNITLVFLFVFLALSVFTGIVLCKNTGIKVNDRILFEKIVRKIPFDILTLIAWGMSLILYLIAWFGCKFAGMHASTGQVAIGTMLSLIISAALALWMVFLRVKIALKTGYKNLPSYRLLRNLFINKDSLINRIPSKIRAIIILFAYVLLQFLGVFLSMKWDNLAPWAVVLLITVPFVIYYLRNIVVIKETVSKREPDGSSVKIDTKGMIGDLRDISDEYNSLDKRIERAVAEQIKKERVKLKLIADLSSDLETPLNSITNYVDLLSMQDLNEIDSKEYIEVLKIYSDRLTSLVEDIIEMTKSSTYDVEVNLMENDAESILSHALDGFGEKSKEKNIEIVFVKPEEPVYVLADNQLLEQVFENLLSNICKHSLENSRVYIKLSTQGEEVHYEFKNISKKALDLTDEAPMEKFVNDNDDTVMVGRDFGLSIAKNLVELQNGLLHIDTDGDMFKVLLRFQLVNMEEKTVAADDETVPPEDEYVIREEENFLNEAEPAAGEEKVATSEEPVSNEVEPTEAEEP